jgi:hypothetical protein
MEDKRGTIMKLSEALELETIFGGAASSGALAGKDLCARSIEPPF